MKNTPEPLEQILDSVLSQNFSDISYYDAIDILDKALYEIRENNVIFSEEDKETLRYFHKFTLAVSLHLLQPYKDINKIKNRRI